MSSDLSQHFAGPAHTAITIPNYELGLTACTGGVSERQDEATDNKLYTVINHCKQQLNFKAIDFYSNSKQLQAILACNSKHQI